MPEALKPYTVPGLIIPGAGTAVFGGDGILYRVAAGVLSAVGPLRAERTTLAAQYIQLDGGDSTGTRITAEYTSQKFLRINNNGAAGVVTTASIQFALGDVVGLALVAGDKLLFGSAGDTDLYRSAAAGLATTSRLNMLRNAASYGATLINPHASAEGLLAQLGNAAGGAFMACMSADTAYRWYVAANGVMYFGAGGSTAVDTNLYRSAADTLRTDDSFIAGSGLTGIGINQLYAPAAGSGAASGATNWLRAPQGATALWLGSGTDTSGLGVDGISVGIRFDGSGVAWGDLMYLPNGGGSSGRGHFRFGAVGSAQDPVPTAKVGVGSLHCVGAATVGGNITAPAVISPNATKTANYTLTGTDSTIFCNAAMTATLPSATTAGAGRRYTIKNRHGSATVTLASTAGNIDGVATLSLASMEAVTVESDGTDWWAV